MTIETLTVDAWLASKLNDATLLAAAPGGVWADVAPEGTASPWVVFFLVAAADVNALGARRVLVDAVYEVRVTGVDVGYGALKTAANRVDALLQGASGTNSDGTVIGCQGVEPVRFMEQDGDRVYRHLGRQYQVLVQ